MSLFSGGGGINGTALFFLLRFFTNERVRNGLANARAKGIHIGRKRTRPSELIRALLKKKLPYRMISSLASCSHGAVYSELVALRREQAEAKLKQEQEEMEKQKALSMWPADVPVQSPGSVEFAITHAAGSSSDKEDG